ncbi:phytanoyl-CoA dioxygenase family protein [Lederbergia wuyishanensis]|uniref:Ectoine hydroxylase-related dioxygenase (Phytanoyl-CoA dioxygenase family) n=1 Tax=Lederbergia wuyishanensis TaxID=1347903 RepID=A0ABU0D9H1_9BACI|nr:phytanoyl-CoA dioxygenase family protein [Lederbergia wuyishanensis]MCJ8007484.1 phytanoyl-CoA dioxygenase family protein [Lederbergia wuyishanensis]MDQ0345077.1 ectoine hydroxylase-related dioxygenase (phytanoyl-CoA dioxygenase family) [Lederbergia wuyishanensis]
MISARDVEFYKENGYLLVKNVFNSQEVEKMKKAIENILLRAAEANKDANHTWQGDYIPEEELKKLVLKGFHDVHYHDAAFTKAVAHPNMVSILSQLIGSNVQLHHSKMLVKPPEKGAAFPMHQDHPYFPHEKHTVLAASVHLDNADEQNGCIHVIPGSHKAGPIKHIGSYYLDPKEYPIESGVSCPAEAGDVLFFNYLTIHGSKPNSSERTRRNVLFEYRDPADLPTKDVHVNWGQGLMVCGENPRFREYRPEYQLVNN